jgi:hypothetical protein
VYLFVHQGKRDKDSSSLDRTTVHWKQASERSLYVLKQNAYSYIIGIYSPGTSFDTQLSDYFLLSDSSRSTSSLIYDNGSMSVSETMRFA